MADLKICKYGKTGIKAPSSGAKWAPDSIESLAHVAFRELFEHILGTDLRAGTQARPTSIHYEISPQIRNLIPANLDIVPDLGFNSWVGSEDFIFMVPGLIFNSKLRFLRNVKQLNYGLEKWPKRANFGPNIYSLGNL